MKKRFKLLCSLMAFCVALAALVFGVYAAQTFNYTYNGSMTYDVNYGFLQIQTSVYKYTKNTLTQTEAQAYMEDFSELELVPEYSHFYCTYDGNKLMKENVESQTVNNLNLDYGEGLAYFVVVNVKSISTRAIQATVTSTYNIENSWSTNTGDTVIVKNDTGKNIVFASGITNAIADCEGSFSYNINFDLIEDYTPQTTGSVEFSMFNSSTPNFTQSFNEFTEADDFEQITAIELESAQMIQSNSEYAAVANFTAGNFSVDQLVSYRFKNVRLYDASGNLITDRTVNYGYLIGDNYDNYSQVQEFVNGLATQPSLTKMPIKCSVVVARNQEVKTCLYFVVRTNETSPDIAKATFDVEITFVENVDDRENSVQYEYRVSQVQGGNAIILPGKNSSKHLDELEITSSMYDAIDVPEYCAELSISMNELITYLQTYGRYEFKTMPFNSDIYGNTLIWLQAVLLTVMTEELGFYEMGYFPIFKEDTVITDGETSYNFVRNNWAADLYYLIMIMQSGSYTEDEIKALASQYLTPIPTDLDEVISIPFQVGRIKNLPYDMVGLLSDLLKSLGDVEGSPAPELTNMLYFNLGAEMARQSPYGLDYFDLEEDFDISDFVRKHQNNILLALSCDYGVTIDTITEIDIDYYYYIPSRDGTMQVSGSSYTSYYETADAIIYNAEDISLDISAIATKEFKTDNSSLITPDGVLYTKTNILAKYPSLKQGGRYDVIDGTKTISSNAFRNATYLSTVVFPKSIVSLGNNIFTNSNVSSLYVYGDLINTTSTDLASQINLSNIQNLYIFVTDYISSNMVNNLASKITTECSINYIYLDDANGITYEAKEDGAYVTGITNKSAEIVIIPTTIQIGEETYNIVGIDTEAFKDCTSLTSLEIPNTIKVIGDNAFAGCTSLTELYLDDAALTTFGTGNTREDLIIYTTDSTTQSTIHTTETNAISVDWQLQVDGGNASFNYVLNIGENSYKINGYTKRGEAGLLNRIMIIFPSTTDAQNIYLTVDFTAHLDQGSGSNPVVLDGIQEQISLSKNNNGTYTQVFGTSTDETYYNEYSSAYINLVYPKTGEDATTVTTGSKLRLRIYFTIMQHVQCFTAGTQVTMADGTYKNIEDVTYDDLLMVYDFDIGDFGVSYPAWIAIPGVYDHYYIMYFDDGSTLEIVLSHRLFTDDHLDYEKTVDADYSKIGAKFPRQVMENGVPKLKLVTCTNIVRVNQEVSYYNMVTSQALNFFSNGYIGATGIANMYTFEKIDDQTYVHNQDQLNATRNGTTDDETGTMFAYERFNPDRIPYYIYVAYRLGEIRNMVNILKDVPPYNQYPLAVVEAYAINLVNDYFKGGYMEDIAQMPDTFKVTLSDRKQTTRYNEGDFYTLPTPNNTTNFVGWYNTFDGKMYQAGESAEIYMNTHFIARYSA